MDYKAFAIALLGMQPFAEVFEVPGSRYFRYCKEKASSLFMPPFAYAA